MRKLVHTFIAGVLAAAPAPACAQMHAHVINTGQGQSVLLEFADAAILVDAGGDAEDAARQHLLGYLDTFFRRRTDLARTLSAVVVTHPHIDHTRFLMDVLRGFAVRELVGGGRSKNASGFPQVRQARTFASQHGIVYNRVPDVRIGRRGYQPAMLRDLKNTASDVDVRFLNGSATCENENNNSLAMLVRYRAFSMLIPGDAEMEDVSCTAAIARMLRRFRASLLDVDLYVVGHHGSRNGTTLDYLTAMSPRLAVISAGDTIQQSGAFNAFAFGHPRESAVAMVERATTMTRPAVSVVYTMDAVRQIHHARPVTQAVYCTCWDGDVIVDIDTTGAVLTVRTGIQP
jgi:competence protein ComEC